MFITGLPLTSSLPAVPPPPGINRAAATPEPRGWRVPPACADQGSPLPAPAATVAVARRNGVCPQCARDGVEFHAYVNRHPPGTTLHCLRCRRVF